MQFVNRIVNKTVYDFILSSVFSLTTVQCIVRVS